MLRVSAGYRASRAGLVAGLVLGCSAHIAARPFTAEDLVAFDRVSDPQLSADAQQIVFALREADVDNNKSNTALWSMRSSGGPARRLTSKGLAASSPRFAKTGNGVYFLSARAGSNQLWYMPLDGGEAQQVSDFSVDVGSFQLSPDGKRVAFSAEVYRDCSGNLACTRKRLDARAERKTSGEMHEQLFIRHWDTWSDGTRSQLFIADIGSDGALGAAKLLSQDIDGDVPSKPFGDDSEYTFSPDSKFVVFGARIAGKTEAWSTNFDLYQVPADGSSAPKNLTADNLAWDATPVFSRDGKRLYYRAMTRANFEADRFRILERDLSSGKTREVAPQWDRSPDGITLSADGRTLYSTADDLGHHPLFAINVANGSAKILSGAGSVGGFSVSGDVVVFTRDDLARPANLFKTSKGSDQPTKLSDFNAARLANLQFGEYEQFSFKGANDETVYGWAIKPVGYKAGQSYPTAFLIHGGPQGSFSNQFHYRWNAQTYAGQGFATVMIDFHGSTGYGQKFTDSISGDWGGKPLIDLQKGLAHARSQFAWVDAKRACALGGSYGGYMTNWIAGAWPDGFNCLVTHAGIFDKRFMSYSTEELWFDEWENGGVAWERQAEIESDNPVSKVAQWRTPMLVIHGMKDFRVPFEQGIAAFTALQRRGIASKFLWYPDENHWILKPQNSLQWHHAVNDWLHQHLDVPTSAQ